ncbi:hypothetical protein C8F04DRAFT_1187262 [Mycena alexandri]|uniref:Protein kinase domain-containing protein n=1 Tax=Mycena alexandri TaxID=1745969 RepID=A0AAD6SQD6_9AGAR|nr:hypothetical protein C8F04DRAFT_1187262 [Mycena alexandri]
MGWGPSSQTPLDLMTRADVVAHFTSSFPQLTPPTPSSSSPHSVINPHTTSAGNTASLYEATLVLAEGPQRPTQLNSHQLDVYTTVGHLAVVPKLHAVIKGRFTDWGGLIMEHAGTALSIHEGPCENLTLPQQDKFALYDVFLQLHAAGVVHGDVARRNIRRPSGDFCVVDFDSSTLNHVCPGAACEELAQLRRNLGI